MTLIERVARAIFEVEYPGGEADEYRWERSQDVYRQQAIAAIEAMREPTKPMMERGFDEHERQNGAWEETPTDDGRRLIYQAMIDAALNEGSSE